MKDKKEKIVAGIFWMACGLWILRVAVFLIIDAIRFCNRNYGWEMGDRMWFDIIPYLPGVTIFLSIIAFSLYNKYSVAKRIMILLGLATFKWAYTITKLILRWEWDADTRYFLHVICISFVHVGFFIILPMVLVAFANGRLGKFKTAVKTLTLMVWCALWTFVVLLLLQR